MTERQCLNGDTVRPCQVAALEAEVAELRSELAANAHACGVQMDQARRAEAEAARLRQALAGLLQVTADVDGVSDDMPAQIGTTMGAVRRGRAALAGDAMPDPRDAEIARLREYGLMALDLGQLDCRCEVDGMCGMCLLRAALVGKGE